MRKIIFNIIIILLILQPMFARADSPYAIRGVVLENGNRQPLPGAQVALQDNDALSTLTDENGYFSLEVPSAGSYTVIVSMLGAEKPLQQKVMLDEKIPVVQLKLVLQTTLQLPVVEITAERNPNKVGKTILKGEEIRKIAGSSGDPLRALQSLPGVAIAGNGSAPAVRGSGPGDNFYYADEIPVGKLFHFGGISVFNGDLIEDFNLYSAAFAPYYDNVTGAILDVRLRNPRTDRFGGKVNVNLTGADFLLEGPVNENQSWYFAARRSYFDLLIKSIQRNGVTLQIPNYSDYQGKYLWKVNDDNRLMFSFNGAMDSLRLDVDASSDLGKTQPDLIGTIESQDSGATQAVVWDNKTTEHANNKLIVGTRQNRNQSNIAAAGNVQVDVKSTFVREKFRFLPQENHDVTLSTNAQSSDVGLNLDINNTNCTQFNTGCDLSTATRVQLVDSINFLQWDVSAQDRWRFQPDFTFVGGVRHSYENYLQKAYTEPRLGLEWQYTDKTLLTAGWGRHNQLPSQQQIARNFGNPNLEHIRSDHSVLGVSHMLDELWSWKAETYYKTFSNLVVGVKDPAVNYVNGGSGRSYGMELLIKKEPIEDLSGWLAVTLARSERVNDLTGETFRFQYDEPVNVTWITQYKLSQVWTMGTKWTYHSGAPYTPITGTNGTYSDGRLIPVYAAVNSGTLPEYHRLDIRFDRTYQFETWKLNVYYEINNAYFHHNVVGYNYGPNYDKKEPIEALVIPFSFGLQGEF